MEVRILGPLEVRGESGPILATTPKERAVLEVLALRGGDVVPTEVLIDALWGFEPPRSAPKSLQSHVSRLRRVLPAGAISTEGAGYRLTVSPEDVDAHRFERFVAAGRQAVDGGDPRRAIRLLDRALDLWRGSPLTDLSDSHLRVGQTVRLEELRLAAGEARVDAHLALGHQEAMVAELEALVTEHPLRERFWAQLMLALYRSDRRADALGVYQRLGDLLREELGIDPSNEVRELEAQILQEDPDLVLFAPGPPSSIPTPLTSLIGRDQQRREVGKLLNEHRLVTLLGPGGVGKTRLAIAVARDVLPQWAGGVWWVDVTHADNPGVVALDLAKAIGVAVPPGMTVAMALQRFLSTRELLVVIDNAERMADELGRWLAELLESSPSVVALVTSRIPLRVPGERRYPVPPLELPGDDAVSERESEAMRLFLDRLAERGHHDPDQGELHAMAALCRMVDGLPLGIELLVAGVGARGPVEVMTELQDRGVVPAGRASDDDERHGSLEVVLASTVELLEPAARKLFGRLSVFAGSFDLAAVRAVGATSDAAAALEALVEAALVTPVGFADATRRHQLLETTRVYARAYLEEAEARDAAARHAEYYRQLASRAGLAMEGPDEQEWVDRLHLDDENLRVALRWWYDHEPAGVLAFVRGLGRAWYVWGDFGETRDRLAEMQRLVDRHDVVADPKDVAWLHLRIAWPRFLTGDFAGGEAEMESAVEQFRELDEPIGRAHALAGRAHMTVLVEGPSDTALEWYREAITESRRCGSVETIAWILVESAQALILADRVDAEVDGMLDEAQPIHEASGDLVAQAHLCMDRTLAAYARDDLDEVTRWAERGIRRSRAAGHAVYEHALVAALGVGSLHRGDPEEAAELLTRSAHIAVDTYNLNALGISFQALAAHAAVRERPVDAARLWGAAGALVPAWPLFQRRYLGELMRAAREALGDRWDDEVAAGSALTVDEALTLALG